MNERLNLIGNDGNYLPVVCEMAMESGLADCFHIYRNIPSEGIAHTGAGDFAWNFVMHEFGDTEGLADMPLAFGLAFPRGKDACLRYVGEVAGLTREAFPRIMHPRAYVAGSAQVSHGCLLEPGSVISTEARLGFGVTVKRNASVGHHATIGDFCDIGPGVCMASRVTVGRAVMIGVGAVIRDGITIGENTWIGMGSVVTKDIPAGVIAYGNPAVAVKPNDRWSV
jgi:sugar O-acyltransferase (sialic acid O-acetyltransferase NeuD family)